MTQNDFNALQQKVSRRELIFKAGAGFSGLALSSMLAEDNLLAATPKDEPKDEPKDDKDASPLSPKPSHFPAKAKSVIFLFMYGGPSQVDLFDPKPMLTKMHGKPLPASTTGEKLETFNKNGNLMASPYEFKKVRSRRRRHFGTLFKPRQRRR